MICSCEIFIAGLAEKCGSRKPLVRDIYQKTYIARTENMRQTIRLLSEHCLEVEAAYKDAMEKLTRFASVSQGLLRENERLQKLLEESNHKAGDVE